MAEHGHGKRGVRIGDDLRALFQNRQQIAFALGAALSGIIANLAGFADAQTPTAMQPVAIWVFTSFLPLAVLGAAAAWRLAREVAAGD